MALAMAQDQMREGDAEADRHPWLWVQDKAAVRLSGRPYLPGLPLSLRHRMIHVATSNAQDALFALEEALRCRDLAFVLGEIAGNPKALSLTASRRLSLVAEKHGVPLWLVRLDAQRDLSSARMRWQARAAPSPAPRWNPRAPGAPTWHAELFRARGHPPGEWLLGEGGSVLSASPTPHQASLAVTA
jgi:protein ImuA